MMGYKIIGNDIIFVFDVDDYPNIKNNGERIKDVYVAGEFNDWAPDKWKMKKTSDSVYELKMELSDFTDDFDWEFKFVVNGIHWAEPSGDFKNSVEALNKYGEPLMVYNLKMYTAFATKYGNVKFKLKGYEDADKVIISGTFNRWDETGFKMNKTNYGWEVTLQLRPDIYEYKFIVDGDWIEDPNNPSKTSNKFGGYNSLIDVQKIVSFQLSDFKDAKEVVLSGDFNDWSEDLFKMEKTDKGWIYKLRLAGGKYHYKFIVDGKWITDPYNSVLEYDGNGNINSVCMVK
ncbi:MAG: hypothetical protein ED556_08910 [Winogradskyella sp.]|nr:MAG: hypothetical protein ED556_08910 [Winogradskyella sp.]